jgi:hypothetical protein
MRLIRVARFLSRSFEATLMKRTLLLCAALLCVALWPNLLARGDNASAQDHPRTKAVVADQQVGTWRLVSFKYGDAIEFTDFPKDHVKLKHVTPTHFVWILYSAEGKQVERTAGGTYTLAGHAYTEQLEYGLGEDVMPLVGQEQKFTCKFVGDKWYHSGALSSGLKIEEVWQRERAASSRSQASGAKN